MALSTNTLTALEGLKTITVRPADVPGLPLGASSQTGRVTVTAEYDRLIELDDGTRIDTGVRTPLKWDSRAKLWSIGVLASDDPRIVTGAGCCVIFRFEIGLRQGRLGRGHGSIGVVAPTKTVKALVDDPALMNLSSKGDVIPAPPEPVFVDWSSIESSAAQAARDAAEAKADADQALVVAQNAAAPTNTQLEPYLKTADANTMFVKTADASSYLTTSAAQSEYLTKATAASTYVTKSGADSTYLTKSTADDTYALKGEAGGDISAQLAPYLKTADAEATLGPLVGKTVKLSKYVGTSSNETVNVQAAIDVCLASGAVLECDVPAVIGLGSGVVIGDERANSQQRTILTLVGSLKVKATAATQRLLTLSGTINTTGCDIEADGANLANFPIYRKNFGRATLGRLQALGGLTAGMFDEPSGNNNAWSITKLRVSGCGAKWTGSATVAARSAESGWASTDDGAPYTTWTLATAIPAALTVNQWAAPLVRMGDGRYMQVRRVVNSTTVEILNENKPVDTTETITLYAAAVNMPYYGDNGIWEISAADVRDNPNAAALSYGGYGGQVGTWAQQNNAAGTCILKRATGLTFGHFYTELSGTWLIVRDTTQTGLSIGPGANGHVDEWQGMNLGWMSMTGRNKQPLHWSISKPSGSPLALPPSIPLDTPEYNAGTRNLTPGTVQAYRRQAGDYAFRIDNNYTSGGVGIVKLVAPIGGGTKAVFTLLNGGMPHTIEGGATYTVPIPGEVTLVYWLEGTNWLVRPIGTPQDTITSTAAAPSRVGQIAVTGGQIYMAAGTTAASDWKQIS